MSIPYRSVLDEDERSLAAAFFRMLQLDHEAYAGALLFIDARGEPLEFTYNRAAVRHRFLWSERGLHLAAMRELLSSMLDASSRVPSALFFLAREVPAELFVEQIDVEKPVARVASVDETVGLAAIEEHEQLEAGGSVQLFWVRGRPSDATPAHRLVSHLASRGLLLEPFDRVIAGIREVYDLRDEDGA